ncbi:hypothetical protein pneo_cds_1018 [Pandoravirus neocaledonia]|uniref:Uncharacterized protein n=1 Tax=Pandoravirus neocaledonia TaxID=2107708 RepID=A0A2U7UE40_9VIRU|nr:hypothetical protein pneo_cds_1018 [Pandoravirus neocaledonia]AVK76625.1 hypothetical protein pneo_cds_1018 [Pandoravirus neocaledonia]
MANNVCMAALGGDAHRRPVRRVACRQHADECRQMARLGGGFAEPTAVVPQMASVESARQTIGVLCPNRRLGEHQAPCIERRRRSRKGNPRVGTIDTQGRSHSRAVLRDGTPSAAHAQGSGPALDTIEKRKRQRQEFVGEGVDGRLVLFAIPHHVIKPRK